MKKFESYQNLNVEDGQVPITLHEDERICSLIKKLKEALLEGHPNALENFWSIVEQQGTPLVEPINGNDDEMLTTFIWQAQQDYENVVVASYGIASFDPFKNKMIHIPTTDVWYKSWVLPRNARTVYCISPNDPLISISDYRLDRCVFPSFTQSWTQDPLNHKKYFIPGCLCSGEQDQLMSLLEMPDAPKLPWLDEDVEYPRGTLSAFRVPSQTFETGREVYLYLPPGYDQNQSFLCPLVVAFDGYAFKDFMNGTAIFDYLIAHKKIPPPVVAMVLNPAPNSVTRLCDLACHEPFFSYIASELIPWIRKNYRVTLDPHQTVITGASLGGVASVYMGLIHSEIVGNILAQSGAYWWLVNGEQDWLIHQYVESSKLDLRFFLDVGSLETVPSFANGLSILNANRYLRDVLKAKGYPIKYIEFSGGHDYICWQETFAKGIEHLLGEKEASVTTCVYCQQEIGHLASHRAKAFSQAKESLDVRAHTLKDAFLKTSDFTQMIESVNNRFYNNSGASFDKIPFKTILLNLLLKYGIGHEVLEIGPGAGALAAWLVGQGCQVTCIEPAQELALKAAEKGAKVYPLTIQNFYTDDQYDHIIAISSLIHVPKADLPLQIQKIARFLRPQGIFFVSFIEGEEEGFEDPTQIGQWRYFAKWTNTALDNMLSQHFVLLENHRIYNKKMDCTFLLRAYTRSSSK